MINTTIALDPEFNAMSMESQMLFLRTVPHLDRDGLVIGQPSALWATVAPLQPALMLTMQDAIDEWVLAGLVEVLPTKIGPVLYFSSFHTNQIGMRYDREPPSRLPLPDGYERTSNGLRQIAGNLPEDCRKIAGRLPQQVEVEREVEREVEVEREERLPAPAAAVPDADIVWQKWTANMPGVKTPVIVDSVNELIAEYSSYEICKAIDIACERNKRNLGYVRGILQKGVDTPHRNGSNAPPKGAAHNSQAVDDAFSQLEAQGVTFDE